MRHNWVYPLIFGFALGIFAASLWGFALFVPIVLIGVAGLLLLAGYISARNHFLVAAIATFAFALGIVRVGLFESGLPLQSVEPLFGKSISGEAVIVADPDKREGNTKLVLDLEPSNQYPTSFRILATVDRYPEYKYGDRVHFDGKLTEPQSFSDDGAHIFNYPKWLEKDDIVALMSYPKISLIETGEGNAILRGLYFLKHSFLEKIDRAIPEPESGLLAGLLVGSKQSLGKELQDMFRTAGVVHVVVLSGYNITIVGAAFMRAFAFLPKVLGATFGASGMILFVLMVGASGTAVRATLMALLVLLAQMTGRSADALRILLIAAFFMLLQNPYILAFDPSFELSFLATLGLIVYSPYFERTLTWLPEKWGVRSIAVATLSTQVMVLPILLWMNGLFSVVALPVNLLILGFIPAAMLLGFIAGMNGFISWWIAFPFAFVAELILRYQLFVIHFFASLPFAAISVPAFPFWLALVVYGIYGFYFWRGKKKQPASA